MPVHVARDWAHTPVDSRGTRFTCVHHPELVAHCLAQCRTGRNDRTTEISRESFRRATWTPDGPGVLEVCGPVSSLPVVRGHGPGGPWLVQSWGRLRGDHDRSVALVSRHQAVERAMRNWSALPLGASGTPYHELLPAVLAQRITAKEAAVQWHRMVDRWGERAPDPEGRLKLPPSPERLAEVPYHEFHTLGIEKRRADTIREVARNFRWLARDWFDGERQTPEDATASLRRIRGVGVWTAAVVGGIAFGDPDALLVGDFHVKNTVAWALHGRPRGTDEEMLESLASYAGQRHRVVRWLQLDGWRAPRRGPRRRIVSIGRL